MNANQFASEIAQVLNIPTEEVLPKQEFIRGEVFLEWQQPGGYQDSSQYSSHS